MKMYKFFSKWPAVFKRENWREFFVVKIAVVYLQEGVARPRWYLPVVSRSTNGMRECWFFLFAPFVLCWYILVNMFWSLWSDLLETLFVLKEWRAINNYTKPTPDEVRRAMDNTKDI